DAIALYVIRQSLESRCSPLLAISDSHLLRVMQPETEPPLYNPQIKSVSISLYWESYHKTYKGDDENAPSAEDQRM
ncbi:MAG: hypothetical protein PHD91_01030, partial [bacterium]|nr:hypothetical protein [bacterium]